MLRTRVPHIRSRVSERLLKAFLEDHTPREVAFSFSLGVFITALPCPWALASVRFSSSLSCSTA